MAEPQVNHLPLRSLPAPFAAALRKRDLRESDLRQLLRAGPVRFLVADVGQPLRQIGKAKCFEFWKAEVRPHLADADSAPLDDFPGSYCYFASEWYDNNAGPPLSCSRSRTESRS